MAFTIERFDCSSFLSSEITPRQMWKKQEKRDVALGGCENPEGTYVVWMIFDKLLLSHTRCTHFFSFFPFCQLDCSHKVINKCQLKDFFFRNSPRKRSLRDSEPIGINVFYSRTLTIYSWLANYSRFPSPWNWQDTSKLFSCDDLFFYYLGSSMSGRNLPKSSFLVLSESWTTGQLRQR